MCGGNDNMSLKNLKTGVRISKKLYETEASGGVNIKNVRKIASTGVIFEINIEGKIIIATIAISVPMLSNINELNLSLFSEAKCLAIRAPSENPTK